MSPGIPPQPFSLGKDRKKSVGNTWTTSSDTSKIVPFLTQASSLETLLYFVVAQDHKGSHPRRGELLRNMMFTSLTSP
jgi:hypothetical protein